MAAVVLATGVTSGSARATSRPCAEHGDHPVIWALGLAPALRDRLAGPLSRAVSRRTAPEGSR